MRATNSEKKRPSFSLGQSDKIILILLALLIVANIALNVMQRFGLTLINGVLIPQLTILTVIVLVGWGVYALIRRIKNRAIKLAVGSVLTLLVLIGLVISNAYVSYVSPYMGTPQKLITVQSRTDGRKAVVFWRLSQESIDHTDQRRLARLEAYPDSGEETGAVDVCVEFVAYPQVLGWFYRSDAEVEGSVFLAYQGSVVSPAEALPAQTPEATEQPAETAGAAAPEATEQPTETAGAAAPEATEQPTETAGAAAPEDAEPTLPHGTLMVEWPDERTARFYVDNPGPAEGGEIVVKF